MTNREISEYQNKLKPWVPKHDVTMKDVVVSGYVSEVVYIVDAIIFKLVAKGRSPKG
jgi:hypothetical protein